MLVIILLGFFPGFFFNKCQEIYNGKNNVVIRSWVSKEVFSQVEYQDRNFGVLGEKLKDCGKIVWYAPLFFNMDNNIYKTLKKLATFKERFLLPERHVPYFFCIKTIIKFFNSLFVQFRKVSFSGFDIEKIVRSAHLESSCSINDMHSYLMYLLLKKKNFYS